MKPIVRKWAEDKGTLYKKNWSRVLTNRMTVVGWRMYKSDRTLHFPFILYRMKIDLGFTQWEIANFTGIPVDMVNNYMQQMKTTLDAEVIKNLAGMDWEKEEHGWRVLPAKGKRNHQGYFVKDWPAWYDPSKKTTKGEPLIKVGGDTEREFLGKLEKQNEGK